MKRVKSIFDLDFYLYVNTDLADQNLNGWTHWISHGRFESRSVNPLIDFTLLNQVLPHVAPEYRIFEYFETSIHWHNSISLFLPVRLEKSLLNSNLGLSPIELVILDIKKHKKEILSLIESRYDFVNISKFSKRFRTLDYIMNRL
jgi:hypothetical protein